MSGGASMSHSLLVQVAAEWLASTRKCTIVLTEFDCAGQLERPDAIGWRLSEAWSILVECKTSRGDFARDLKKPSRTEPDFRIGQERWYLAPAGLLRASDIPKGWGLLEAGANVRVVVPSPDGPSNGRRGPTSRDIQARELPFHVSVESGRSLPMTREPVIDGDSLRVVFSAPWDEESYALFLRTKLLPEHDLRYDEDADIYTVEAPARFAKLLGLDVPTERPTDLPFPDWMWDYQRHFVGVALEVKRYDLFWDTGLGKGPAGIEWCRQVHHRTSGRVLYCTPLNLIPEILGQAKTFYGDSLTFEVLETRADLRRWCKTGTGLALTNPEKFLPRKDEPEVLAELSYISGFCLDEASLLKTGGGRIRWAIIKSARGIEYKLGLTATPAPNDPIEYASQAALLEKIRDEGEVIWTYFVRDSDGEWKIKEHALAAFYKFLSGWSCYVRHPARYGFADNLKDLPPAQRFEHVLPATDEQLAVLRQVADANGQTSLIDPERLGIVERGRYAQLSSGFLYQSSGRALRVASPKPAFLADLIRREVAEGLQVIVWTLFDETVEILREELADASFPVAVVTGSVPQASRPAIVEAFRAGAEQVLISRPEVLGFGCNLQCAGSVIWADLDDSFERKYQGERRAYRYGQTRSVRIHDVRVEGLQDVVWQNLQGKGAQFERDVARMERLYIDAMRGMLPGKGLK